MECLGVYFVFRQICHDFHSVTNFVCQTFFLLNLFTKLYMDECKRKSCFNVNNDLVQIYVKQYC